MRESIPNGIPNLKMNLFYGLRRAPGPDVHTLHAQGSGSPFQKSRPAEELDEVRENSGKKERKKVES